jgi:zinc and cadmium transporter
MAITWVLALSSVLVVSSVSLIGLAALALSDTSIRRVSTVLVAFAVGTMLGDAFLHLLPEALAEAPSGATLARTLAGFLVFFALEKLVRHRHGPLHRHHHGDREPLPERAAINLLGDALHNFIDGVLIGASWLVSPGLGLSTTLAVLLHELPQELGDFGVLLQSGLSVRRAALLNLASASSAMAGTLVTLVVGELLGHAVTEWLVPVTAGAFLYIGAAGLVPELQHDRTGRAFVIQSAAIALGVGLMALLMRLEG